MKNFKPNYSLRYYCTCFDRFFLPRGLSLYSSLNKNCPNFLLYVFCLDKWTYDYFICNPRDNLIPYSIENVESKYPDLHEARSNRSRIEFYFTCTPFLPLHILKTIPEIDLITYLDADFFFFSSPESIYEEFGDNSIGITAHRYAAGARRFSKYGTYNVGWLMFRRDIDGIACLEWWRQRCIEWCHDRYEDGKFADQGYLSDWPERFNNVLVIEHKGANVAGWNVRNHSIQEKNGSIYIDDVPLIFFHFASFKEIRPFLFKAGFSGYLVWPSLTVRRCIFQPYIQSLAEFSIDSIGKRMRSYDMHMVSIIKSIRNFYRVLRSIVFFDYLIFLKGKIW